MGVLNVTPDSFSDGGQLTGPKSFISRAEEMLAAGVDVLDIGGESTRPGAIQVNAEDELARVLPAIRSVRDAFPQAAISVDTYKAAVAEAAISAGADIINDVWGLAHGLTAEDRTRWCSHATDTAGIPALSPTAMAVVAAKLRAPVILMHNRLDREYGSFWDDLLLDLKMSLAIATTAGIPRNQLWLDPGFGFAKSPAQNLETLRELHRIVALGFPVLVGTSRKSTLGVVLGARVDDRIEGGGATIVWAIQQGCAMVRVHDVPEMVRFAKMADAIKAGLRFAPSS